MGCVKLHVLDRQYKGTELKVRNRKEELTSNFGGGNVRRYLLFGTTSYRSGRSETEVSLKRYKYNGKERDEETGLYYFGARYYAAWICRFISVDGKAGNYPQHSPFIYCACNPVKYIDPDGNAFEIATEGKTKTVRMNIYTVNHLEHEKHAI